MVDQGQDDTEGRIPADTAEFLGGDLPTYKDSGVMTIQGKKVDMNKLRDPFKLRDAARDAGISLPDQLPDGLEAAFERDGLAALRGYDQSRRGASD
jgi:hypothetical protein